MKKKQVIWISIILVVVILLIVFRKKIFKAGKRIQAYVEMDKTWDFRSDARISGLHPHIRQKAINLINDLEKAGIKIRVTSGMRTFAEQTALYAKGRGTKREPRVTNAKAGESYHNYGLAFDVVEIKDGKALWTNPNWEKIGKAGEKAGFGWGGRWKDPPDRPHFQFTAGFKTSDLFARAKRITDEEYVKIT